jgi:hypothetical protein
MLQPHVSLRSFAVLGLASLAHAKVYNLLRYNGGQNFFDAFQYFGTYDTVDNTPTADFLNSGDDWMANKSYADSAGLTTINSAGHAIVRVDDTSTVVFNDKRFSVRINTTEVYSPGNVFVFDAVHIPFGCSVWPAYWTAARTWPAGGEIDIMENVNQATINQMSLHTSPGCSITQGATGMTGTVSTTNCGDPSNSGCIVQDLRPTSYGAGFNAAGGGMWVTEFANESISIWFFSRPDIPAAITSASNASSIDTSALGTPTALYPASTCDITQFFQPQSIVIDISLCGVFARPTFNETCPPTQLNACYLDWVIGPPANYSQAYFEIVSLRVFNDGTPGSFSGQVTAGSGGTSGSGSGGTSGSGTSGNGSISGSGNGLGTGAAAARVGAWGASAALAAVAAVAVWCVV